MGGLTVSEPVTVLTDLALGLLCLMLADRLFRARPESAARLMAASFVLLAVAAVAGGTVHGFARTLPLVGRARLWNVVYAGIGLANVALVASVLSALAPRVRPLIFTVAGLRAIVLLFRLAHGDARLDLYDVATTVVVGVGAGLAFTWLRPRPFGPWLLGGMVVSLAGGAIQTWGIAPHPHFNHNDLFHVMQMAAQWCFFRAALTFPAVGAQRSATTRALQGQ